MEMKELKYLDLVPNVVDSIFVLMHGYGSSPDDLIPIGMSLRTLLPTTAFIFPFAPEPCETADRIGGIGYQWFSLKSLSLFHIQKEIKGAYMTLSNFIDSQLERFHLTNENLMIGGFSQGAMMTLYTGPRRMQQPKCLLAFSGMMPDTMDTIKDEIHSRPNICLIHGTADSVVPYQSMEEAENLLKNLDIPYETYTVEGMGHEINNEALEYAKEFIQNICNKY
jgi:phospholipase/carboxylesterase